jgi:hypothetical protein
LLPIKNLSVDVGCDVSVPDSTDGSVAQFAKQTSLLDERLQCHLHRNDDQKFNESKTTAIART